MERQRTPNKMEQNNLMNSGGLNRFMASQPSTYSPIFSNSPLAHKVNCIKDTNNEDQKRQTTMDICNYGDLILIKASM